MFTRFTTHLFLSSIIFLCVCSFAGPSEAGFKDYFSSDRIDKFKKKIKTDSNAEDPPTPSTGQAQPEAVNHLEKPDSLDSEITVDIKKLTAQIQTQLNKLGFNAGAADGVSGTKTRNAMCHFQQSAGLNSDPRATPELLSALIDPSIKLEQIHYTKFLKAECEVAYMNNIQNLTADAYHAYEGALAPSDGYCQTLVTPFKMRRNFDFLKKQAKSRLKNFFNKKIMGKSEKTNHKVTLEDIKLQAKKSNWLPLSLEIKYGESLHQKRLADNKLLKRSKRKKVRALYKKADAALETILANITEAHPYEFKLYLVDDESINAEAIAGGYLYVNTGVIKADYQDLVIGHELSHILQRHTTRELQAKLVDTVNSLKDLRKLLTDKNWPREKAITQIMILNGVLANYSQKQELQSDACAVRIASRSQKNIIPSIEHYIKGMNNGNTRLKRNSSTHPAYPERKNRMMSVASDIKKKSLQANNN